MFISISCLSSKGTRTRAHATRTLMSTSPTSSIASTSPSTSTFFFLSVASGTFACPYIRVVVLLRIFQTVVVVVVGRGVVPSL